MYRFLDSLPHSFFDIMQRSAATDDKLTATPTNYTFSVCLRLGLTRHVPINWYWPASKLGSIELRLFSALISHIPCARDYAFPPFVSSNSTSQGLLALAAGRLFFNTLAVLTTPPGCPRKRLSTLALAPSRQHVVD